MAPNASIWMSGGVQTAHWQEPHLYGFDLPCYRVNTFQDPVQMLNSCVVAMRLVDLVGLDVQRMLRLGNPQALPAKCCLRIILLLPKYNASKVSAIQMEKNGNVPLGKFKPMMSEVAWQPFTKTTSTQEKLGCF